MSFFPRLSAAAALNRHPAPAPLPPAVIGGTDLTGMSGEQMFGNAAIRHAPLRRDFSPEAKLRALVRHWHAAYGAAAARQILDSGLEQVRLCEAEARDPAQTVREAQGQQEVGL